MSTNKKIELWDGYEVEFNEQLADDFDFASDLALAEKSGDIVEMVAMYFALVGGEEVYEETRAHIIKETGHFSTEELTKVIQKITDCFPKAGNRAQRRSWQTSK